MVYISGVIHYLRIEKRQRDTLLPWVPLSVYQESEPASYIPPALITQTGVVLDGHKRLAQCTDPVPVLVCEIDSSVGHDAVFLQLNAHRTLSLLEAARLDRHDNRTVEIKVPGFSPRYRPLLHAAADYPLAWHRLFFSLGYQSSHLVPFLFLPKTTQEWFVSAIQAAPLSANECRTVCDHLGHLPRETLPTSLPRSRAECCRSIEDLAKPYTQKRSHLLDNLNQSLPANTVIASRDRFESGRLELTVRSSKITAMADRLRQAASVLESDQSRSLWEDIFPS